MSSPVLRPKLIGAQCTLLPRAWSVSMCGSVVLIGTGFQLDDVPVCCKAGVGADARI